MSRERTVTTPHGPVGATMAGPRSAAVGVLLAHGAGAGRGHPWMVGMCDRLADRGFLVMAFDYAYIQAGRKAPDRLPKLLDVHEACASVLTDDVESILLAGKSMGGRVGGHLVAEGRSAASGIAYYGYPLVAIGKTEPRATDHLATISVPQLFVSGDRDRLGPIDLVRSVADGVPDGTLVVIEDGDHSLVPRKATGRTLDDGLDAAADATAGIVRRA